MRGSGAMAQFVRRLGRRLRRLSDRIEDQLDHQRSAVTPDILGQARIPNAENWTYYGEKPPWLAQENDHIVEDALASFAHRDAADDDGAAADGRPPDPPTRSPRG